MADPFMGEVSPWAISFAPKNWANCDGQILPVAQYSLLYSLIGNLYGGWGKVSFALPNLSGRVPVHAGTGKGLSQRSLGDLGGSEAVSLTANELPPHTHPLYGISGVPESETPSESTVIGILVNTGQGVRAYTDVPKPSFVTMSKGSIADTGDGEAHPNMQPYAVVRYCIALEGVYPTFS